MIALGFHHFGLSAQGSRQTVYHLQAAIAAVHAGTEDPARTPWEYILALYDELLSLTKSPVVAPNRAVALSKVQEAEAALAAIAPLDGELALGGYYLLPAVKARLLTEAGDRNGAAAAYRQALARPCTEPERRFLTRRLSRVENETAEPA